MMDIIYWLIVILGNLLAIYTVINVFVIAFSLFNEVPFVPLDRQGICKAIELLEIQDGDRFVDIGSGNGRVVLMASSLTHGRAAKYNGVEYFRLLAFFSNIKRVFSRFSSRITFEGKDAFTYDFSEYNKVFLYLTGSFASMITRILLKQLKSGSRIVCAYFPIQVEGVNVKKKDYTIAGKKRSFYTVDIP